MIRLLQEFINRIAQKDGKQVSEVDPKEILADLQPQIDALAKTYIHIRTSKTEPLTFINSKFGGFPYFPANQNFPTSKEGKPLRLLAQLNFAEMPNLSPYPTEGLLQFYVTGEDNLHGLNLRQPSKQEDWRVLFFDTLDFEARNDFDELYESDWKYSPLMVSPLSLEFELKQDYPSYPSLEYHQLIQPLFQKVVKGDFADLLEDLYLDKEFGIGHKVGGFPYFTQNEVRENQPEFSDYQLLFQLDSDADKIMWGDVGVANFFIRKEDLVKRDFDRVLYNWDCH
ncbi:MAG: DUF1963 domain-containing protein [Chitinophagales bacterium]